MYAFQQAMRAIRANWIASVATITTMTLSLTILAGVSFVTLNLNQLLASLQDELEISAFLLDSANIPELLLTINNWPETSSVILIPKEQALLNLQLDLPSLSEAADIVGNPLPNTLSIQLLDPSFTPSVSARLQGLAGVNEVIDGSDEAATFLAINESVRLIGLILVMILMMTGLFAIVNSIRAAITARRAEIDVMRLVGAKRSFIRAPFLIEGLLLGLLSAVVSLALVIPGYQYVVARLSEQLRFVPFVRDPFVIGYVAVLLLILAILVGLVGSALSVTQHLREES